MKGRRNQLLYVIGILISISLIVSAFYPSERKPNSEVDKLDIALILRTASDDYWHYVQRGADSAALESNVHLTVYAPNFDGDVEGQLSMAKSILESNPDAIILGANDDLPFMSFLVEANEKRVPVLAVDSLLSSGTTSGYIGSNNFLAGQLAVDEMVEHIGEAGNIIVVNYEFGGINARLREAGVDDRLLDYDSIQLLRKIECSLNIQICQSQIRWVYENNDVDGVIALMNKPSYASALALQDAKLPLDVKIVGFDSSNALLELMQEGYMETLFVQNPFAQGYLSVKQAISVVQGDTLQQNSNMPMTKITHENMFWLQHQKLLFPVVN